MVLRSNRLIMAAAAFAVALNAGCATTGPGGPGGSSSRPEVEAALDHDTEFASARIILQAAAVGAALGCGIGLLLGGGVRSCAEGALLGGAGGAVAGGVAAAANDRQIMAEDRQDALYADLVAEREDLRAYNTKMSAAVARLRDDYALLRSQQAAKQISAEQYASEKRSIDRDIARLEADAQEARQSVVERNEEIETYNISSQISGVSRANLAYIDDISRELQELDNDI